MMKDDVWPSEQSAYITAFRGFTPETRGCIGFTKEGRRDTYLQTTTELFIMVIFVTETAPTDQPALRGKVAGFYEISHETGYRAEFTDPRHHRLEPGRWRYAPRALSVFRRRPGSAFETWQIGCQEVHLENLAIGKLSTKAAAALSN